MKYLIVFGFVFDFIVGSVFGGWVVARLSQSIIENAKCPNCEKPIKENEPMLNWTFRQSPGPHYQVRRGDKS